MHTLYEAFSLLDREGPLQFPMSQAQLHPTAVIPDLESLPQVCNHFRLIVAEEVAREHKAVATSYAESRKKRFVGHLFYWLFKSRTRTEEGFLSIH